jgi:alkyl sulfatase BDS1-like metallo-beta-lactamase superfamily hydrolase
MVNFQQSHHGLPTTRTIEKDIEEVTVDGVTMVFQKTPGTEAPTDMNAYLPEYGTGIRCVRRAKSALPSG